VTWQPERRSVASWATYDLANIPSYWLVDRKGTLRHTGLQGEALEEAIRALLKE
jgi:hypothetical protein